MSAVVFSGGSRVWLLWPGHGFPFDASGESGFVSDLSAASSSSSSSAPIALQRDDVTLLMSMLRSGASLEASLRFAPGLQARVPYLLAAYQLLETERASSHAAWSAMMSLPRSRAVRYAQAASRMLPKPTAELLLAPREAFAQARSALSRRAEGLHRLELELYDALADCSDPVERARLSDMLFNPLSGGLFRRDGFVPSRLSALSPELVGRLLPDDLPQGRV